MLSATLVTEGASLGDTVPRNHAVEDGAQLRGLHGGAEKQMIKEVERCCLGNGTG